jgi:hypothetical protein
MRLPVRRLLAVAATAAVALSITAAPAEAHGRQPYVKVG